MCKQPILETESQYISANKSPTNITSRKVIYASVEFPIIGVVNFFSTHTHWRTSETDEEQNKQVQNIQAMVKEKEGSNTAFSIVGGDFNVNPTSSYPWSEAYNRMVSSGEFIDSYLTVHTDANTKPALSKYNTVEGDFPGRIDYIFFKQNPKLKVEAAQIIFTSSVIGEVSDHYGVLTKFSIAP